MKGKNEKKDWKGIKMKCYQWSQFHKLTLGSLDMMHWKEDTEISCEWSRT